MFHEHYKVLLIFSQINTPYFDRHLISIIDSETFPYLEFTYLIDPKRKELELSLQQNNYLCIIPCTQYTVMEEYHHKYKLNNYVVSQLLQNLNLEFWGCSYISTLILHEKAICSQMTLGIPKPLFITKYNYKSVCNLLKEQKVKTPIILEPVYANNYLPVDNYKVNSVSEADALISEIFNSDLEINELYLYETISSTERIIITIIGNPPLSFDFICETSIDFSKIKIVNDKNKYTRILSNSYHIFSEYNFRDFGQFVYSYDKEKDIYYLVDINYENCLSNIAITAFQQYFSITSIIDILRIFLIVYLSRLEQTHITVDLIKKCSLSLPEEITESIIPFSIKQTINLDYNYKRVCAELKNRFLFADEKNRDEFLKYVNSCLRKIPDIQNPNEVYLGNVDKEYFFLQKYEILPSGPQNAQEILDDSMQILNGQMRWHAPSMLYNVNPPVMFNTVAATAVTKLYNPNAITSRTCSGFIKMERQIVRQLSRLLGWDEKESDGVFTPGGKYCLTYAIKCGLNRLNFPTQEQPVVITSEINHYSIESVCEQLGLGGKCIRIPVTHEGVINFDIFKRILIECFTKKIPIACIIFSGGNTTHCNVENIKKGYDLLYTLIDRLNINYIPYIYYDLVVCWPWLFFKYYDFYKNKLDIQNDVLAKITTTLEKVLFVRLADGAGIDFHKGGFAPYSCSVFLSRNAGELYSIFDKTVGSSKNTSIEPNRYTLGNSRGTSDILSAWNILQSVGIEGFQSYVVNMLAVANVFANNLSSYDFTILEKNYTYGFATIIWSASPQTNLIYDEFIKSDERIIAKNNEYLYALSQFWIANKECSYYTRFLPNYRTIANNRKIAIISLLPMTLNIDEEQAKEICSKLGELKRIFDQKYLSGEHISILGMPENVEK